jgi:hypothetical protein
VTGYPALTEIEIAWLKSGTGVCIIVEGELSLRMPGFITNGLVIGPEKLVFFLRTGVRKSRLP